MHGGPIVRHLDDVPTEEMSRFRYADGRTASIWEKWIEMSPRYLAFWNKWDPGALSPPHGHHGDHPVFVLEGEMLDREGNRYPAGTHIMLEYGDIFGPFVAGPQGCTLYGFVAAEGGSGGASYMGLEEAENWQSFLAELGAESLPVPRPKRIPPWWAHRFGGPVRTTKWADE